jgi:type II secretory pathway pseudopilin PulG
MPLVTGNRHLRKASAWRCGATLIELLVYMGIASVILTTILMLFRSSGRSYDKAAQSYILTEEALSGYRTIQTDLRETSLGSLTVTDSGFSMISARNPKAPDTFAISPYGVPQWQSYLVYRFEPEPKKKDRYTLVREMNVPVKAPILPLPFSDKRPMQSQAAKVVIRDLLPPGKAVQKGRRGFEVIEDSESHGGAQLSFLRRGSKGELKPSSTHPSQGDPLGNTGMVKLELRFLGYSEETGHLNYAELHLHVTPRN